MIKKTNCSWIVTLAHAHQSLINAICQESEDTQLTIDELPTLACAFPKLGNEVEADPFDPYPPPSKRPELHSPAIYVHSSGSTAFPKAIAHSHQFQIHWLTQRKSAYLNAHPGSLAVYSGDSCVRQCSRATPSWRHGASPGLCPRSYDSALFPTRMPLHYCGPSSAHRERSACPASNNNEGQYHRAHPSDEMPPFSERRGLPRTNGLVAGGNRGLEEYGVCCTSISILFTGT
jgi:hypothetical protein